MLKDNILIGGEESGGIGIKGHIPERDGILAGLLLVEMLATRRKSLKQLLFELKHQVGSFYYERRDIRISEDAKEKWIAKFLLNEPQRINGMKIKSIDRRDGVKYLLDNGNWLMLRASGTEPVIRVYAEAKSAKEAGQLLEEGYSFLTSCI